MCRRLRTDETELLKTFLYEAIFIPEGVEAPDRSIIEQPELKLYYEGFGKGKADHCLVAEEDGICVDEPGDTQDCSYAGHLCHRVYDLTKLREAGIRLPSTGLHEGIEKTLKYMGYL